MKKIKVWLKLLRVKHYVKNLLIVFPLFFSKEINRHNICVAVGGVVLFSLVASMVYIINDMNDLEKDKVHPEKCSRPLAAGTLGKREAKSGLAVIGIIIIGLTYIFQIGFTNICIILIYILMNIFYSRYAKNIPIIDVLILAAGYLLRIFIGAGLIGVKVSNWLYLTVLFGALFMGLGKRRGEIKYVNNNNTREVLAYYNEQFLDKNMYMSLAITIVFYALWCVSEEISSLYPEMIWTTILVYVICMKYTLILEKNPRGGDPVSIIFSDKLILGLIMSYVICISWIMYF